MMLSVDFIGLNAIFHHGYAGGVLAGRYEECK